MKPPKMNEKLTMEIMEAVLPLLDGHNTEYVLDSMAAAMMALVSRTCTPAGKGIFLRRYAAVIENFAVTVSQHVN